MKNLIWTLLVPTALMTANCQKDKTDTPFELSEEQKAGLQFMYEEEKMARDLYRAAEATYDHHTFSHIQSSENRHMERVAGLLDHFGLENPAEGLEEGKFTVPEIQTLFDSLYLLSQQSLVDALGMGALVEEKDILDLREVATDFGPYPIVVEALTNLERASGNHLRAYVRQLSYEGEDYVPVLMSQTDFDAIISAPHGGGGG